MVASANTVSTNGDFLVKKYPCSRLKNPKDVMNMDSW